MYDTDSHLCNVYVHYYAYVCITVQAVDQSQGSLFPSQSEGEVEDDALLPQVHLRCQLLPSLCPSQCAYLPT